MDSDEFAEKVKAKLMPSIERLMREIMKHEAVLFQLGLFS